MGRGQHKDKGNNDKQERTKKKKKYQTKYSLQTKKTFFVNKI